jgi:sugar diacid utilization regulator
MRIFSFAITKSDQASLEISAAFKNAIFFPQQEELYVVPLSQRGFHVNWNYYVCVIKLVQKNDQTVPSKRLETVCGDVDNFLRHRKFKKYAFCYNEHQLLAVLGNYAGENLALFLENLKEQLNICLLENENYYMGIGKSTKSLRCLYKSYRQALSIQNLQQNNKISRSLISYSNMGIYKLLMGIEDRDILTEYYEKTILPIDEYDTKNNSDLCKVLRCYLKNNGSVKDTADELYVHRNTINYKLNKVSEILNLSLSSLDTRLQLSLGLMLQDML